MSLRRLAGLLAALALVAGCGGEAGSEGTATLWVTRDAGAEVLVETEVDAGQTVLQALRAHAEVETRYGGRFVQAIEGIAGSLERQEDWFYYVNGLLSDRSAAEYRLRDGDVAWWDFRSWRAENEYRAVVGAFPEPFLHGFGGAAREAVVTYELPEQAEAARTLAAVVGGRVVDGEPPAGANVLALVAGPDRFTARLRGGLGGPVHFEVGGDAVTELAEDPHRFRRRYEVRP